MLCSSCNGLLVPILTIICLWSIITIGQIVTKWALQTNHPVPHSRHRRNSKDGNSSSQLHNVTIDDELGDLTNNNHFSYWPTIGWQQGSGCQTCVLKPDDNIAGSGTWHDSSFSPVGNPNADHGMIIAAAVQFTGPAVYVYCIIGDFATDMTFFIDNEQVGSLVLPAVNYSDFQYNTLVYSNTSLENIQHTFRMELGHTGHLSTVLLDYLMYTSVIESSSPPSESASTNSTSASSSLSRNPKTSPSAGMIAGGVLGAISLIVGIFSGAYLLRKRRKNKEGGTAEEGQPHVVDACTTSEASEQLETLVIPYTPGFSSSGLLHGNVKGDQRSESSPARQIAPQNAPSGSNPPQMLESHIVQLEDSESLPPQYCSEPS